MARYLGSVYFGRYSFALAFVGLFAVFSDFGVGLLATREVARDKSKAGFYLSNLLAVRITLSLISVIAICIAISLMHKTLDTTIAIYIAAIWLLVSSLSNSYTSLFAAYERLGYLALLSVFQKVLVLGLGLYALMVGYKVVALFAVILFAELVNLFLLAYVFHGRFVKPIISISLDFCKSFLLKAAPFAVASVLGVIYFRIDVVMLSIMKGDAVVGWYSAAYKLLEAWMFIPACVTAAAFPAFSRLATSSQETLGLAYEKSLKVLLLLALPIMVGTALLAHRIIMLIYGVKFINSTSALLILIWILILLFQNSLLGYVLYALDRQKTVLAIVAIAAVVNVILNLLLIPSLSYIGASIATVLSELIVFVSYFTIVSLVTAHRVNLLGMLTKLVPATIVMGCYIYFLREASLLFLIPSAAITYFVFLVLLKTFTKDEIGLLKEMIGKRVA